MPPGQKNADLRSPPLDGRVVVPRVDVRRTLLVTHLKPVPFPSALRPAAHNQRRFARAKKKQSLFAFRVVLPLIRQALCICAAFPKTSHVDFRSGQSPLCSLGIVFITPGARAFDVYVDLGEGVPIWVLPRSLLQALLSLFIGDDRDFLGGVIALLNRDPKLKLIAQ
uniref:Peptidase A1 domain-containing protein n=1 Tax=Steinernema glaseri TaxID=37863 RepID=A0A1I7YWX0_9BILA